MDSANFNMEDPAKQEQIRRGTHEYIPTAGKHGAYVRSVYKHRNTRRCSAAGRDRSSPISRASPTRRRSRTAMKAWDVP